MKTAINILIIFLLAITSCSQESIKKEAIIQNNKIKVLNFATFHMSSTSDASQVEFNEKNKKNIDDAHQIAKLLATFKPTVIIVEVPPKINEELNTKYQKYLSNPKIASTYYGEIGLVAFEVGRLNNVSKIYGIDHHMGYNYNIGNEIENTLDKMTHDNYFKNSKEMNMDYDSLSLFNRLKLMNTKNYLNFLVEVNADILTHVGTKDNFEGADEATKYYQRNLRMYSNLNRIPLTKEDRVFIIMGGSHTAFFMDFMKRSPKYEVVNTFDYLRQ